MNLKIHFLHSSHRKNCVCGSSVLCAVNILLSIMLQALVHDIYSELVEDACLGLCFEVHRAVKQGYFFLDETDQESMKEFGESHKFSSGTWMFLSFSLVHLLTICALIATRNCGPARSGHIWAGVQSVEEQRVRVPQLQKIDSSVSFRPTLGEMPGNGTQQQSHCQPQVRCHDLHSAQIIVLIKMHVSILSDCLYVF